MPQEFERVPFQAEHINGDLSPDAARSILGLDFEKKDHRRMAQLSAKAGTRTMSRQKRGRGDLSVLFLRFFEQLALLRRRFGGLPTGLRLLSRSRVRAILAVQVSSPRGRRRRMHSRKRSSSDAVWVQSHAAANRSGVPRGRASAPDNGHG